MIKDYGLVSIMMAAYNAEKYIEEAINSILAQTYPNFEFIIVDDGSTDKTSEIIHSFKDERIVYLKHPTNMGVSEARNTALRAAKGKWGALADADDVWLPERLEKLLSAIGEGPYGKYFVADNHMMCFDSPHGLVKWKSSLELFYNVRTKEILELSLSDFLKLGSPVLHPVFPLTMIQANKIFFNPDTHFAEDFEFVCNLFRIGLRLKILPDSYYFYRLTPGSISGSKHSINGRINALESLISTDGFTEEEKNLFRALLEQEKVESKYREFTFYLKKRNFSKAFALALDHPSLPFKLVARLPKILRYRVTAKIKGGRMK